MSLSLPSEGVQQKYIGGEPYTVTPIIAPHMNTLLYMTKIGVDIRHLTLYRA
jgi:hypothetical protein